MNRFLKISILSLFLALMMHSVSAQDAVIIAEGNFVRGTIMGTNYATVQIKLDDQSVAVYKAKDIKEFLWNGDSYVSKPILIKNRMEERFFKVEESGNVNLYSIGGSTAADQPEPRKVRVRPGIGIGMGTGGYGGVGIGGGISFGGGRRQDDGEARRSTKATYYIEKPGTGPMQSLPLDGNSESKVNQVKAILLQKLNNDEDLAERIKATESFDSKNLKAFVNAYNSMHK